MKKPSIPRLDLQVAVIATRLKNTIANEIPIKKENTYLGTETKLENRQPQEIGSISKQSKAQLIIPQIIEISYPYQKNIWVVTSSQSPML